MSVAVESQRAIDKINADIISASSIGPSFGSCEILGTPSRKTKQYGLHTVKDSIASCPPMAFELNPGFYLISLQNTYESVNRQYIALESAEITSDLEELQKLNGEKIEALKQHAIQVNSASTWDSIKNVASYFAFATSSLVGLSACSNLTLSIILVSSGVVGLVNKVLSDTGVWKSIAGYFVKEAETQEKVARYADNSFTIISTGLGLFNVIGGACFGVDVLLDKGSWELAKQAGYYGSTLLSTVSTYKSADTKSKVDKSHSALSVIEGRHSDLSIELKSKMDDVDQTVKDNSRTMEGVHSTIKSIIDNLKKITEK